MKLSKEISNIIWLLSDKGIRFIGTFLVTPIVAKSITVQQMGILNHTLALLSLCVACSSLNLKSIVLNSLNDGLIKRDTIIGTNFYLVLVSSTCTYLALILFTNENYYYEKIILMSIIVFQPIYVVATYYEYLVKSKIQILTQGLGYISFIIMTLLAAFHFGDYKFFIYAYFLDILIFTCTLGFFAVFIQHLELKFSLQYAFDILKKVPDLLIITVSTIAYMKVDILIVGKIADDYALGIYSAAVRFVEIWYFLPLIIMQTFRPRLLNQFTSNTYKNESLFKALIFYGFWLSVLFSSVFFIFRRIFMLTLFSEQYADAAYLMGILIFCLPFLFIENITSVWYYANNKFRRLALRMATGFILNILLSFVFFNYYGLLGIAIATLLCRIYVAVFANLIFGNSSLFKLVMYSIIKKPKIVK